MESELFVPNYLEVLRRSGTEDDWPRSIDDEGKIFAVDSIVQEFKNKKTMSLKEAYNCVFLKNDTPDCLKNSSWDWGLAVAYRALLEVGAKQVWTLQKEFEDDMG